MHMRRQWAYSRNSYLVQILYERCFDSEVRVAGVGSHRGREGTKSVNA